MSTSKVEMSLDDIIKANKGRGGVGKRTAGKGGRPNNRKSNNGQRNKGGISKPQRKGVASRLQRKGNNVRKGKVNTNAVNASRVPKATKIATQKLVNKLVKKALAQKAVNNKVNRVVRNPSNKRGGVRFVKKTVVLNRVSQRSRVIRRRPAVMAPVMETVAVRPRNRVRYVTAQPSVQYVTASTRRNNSFRQRRNARPVFVQQQVIQRRAAPAFRMVRVNVNGGGGGTLRDQIKVMRQTAYTRPQVVQVQQQQRRPQQFRQRQQQVVIQQAPRRQQQPRRFQNNNNQRQQNDPFYEPPNFLQRI